MRVRKRTKKRFKQDVRRSGKVIGDNERIEGDTESIEGDIERMEAGMKRIKKIWKEL